VAVIVTAEDRVAGDNNLCPMSDDGAHVFCRDSTIYLEENLGGTFINEASSLGDLLHHGANEALAAKTGIHGHDEEEVNLGEDGVD